MICLDIDREMTRYCARENGSDISPLSVQRQICDIVVLKDNNEHAFRRYKQASFTLLLGC